MYKFLFGIILCSVVAAYGSHWEDLRMDAELAAIKAERPVFNSNLAWLER